MENFDAKRYKTTLKLILLKAFNAIYPDFNVLIDNSLNKGSYGEIVGMDITQDMIEKINDKMREIITHNYEIKLITDDSEKLKRHMGSIKRNDIKKLLNYSGWTPIKQYEIEGYIDYVYEFAYSHTGDISRFELTKYNNGFLVKSPINEHLDMPPIIDTPKLAKVFADSSKWDRILGVKNIGDLNKKVVDKEILELITINEALHHKKIAHIAEQIGSNKKIKLVTIAGPSSSGKTTFSKRLYIHLRANGIKPIVIGLDNYYIGRDNIPLDENGEKDFETINALDLKLLNDNLSDLIAGKSANIPIYNFTTGKREEQFNTMKLEKNGIIIIEGIHGLNEKLTYHIPRENKFKIYISCLTQLNIDMHNRISTSDVRKIRRLVRDSRSRSEDGEVTLGMWNSVRRGEEKYIFPYQEEADALFNSNLVYELGVLKSYALRELIKIHPTSRYYDEAQRLMRFLYCFVDIDSNMIPNDSLLCEFIGGSIFEK